MSSHHQKKIPVGIDLGTTYSCVACYRHNQVEVIANESGQRTTPSYIAYSPEGELLWGLSAKQQAVTNPKNTLYNIKRLLGKTIKDDTIKTDREQLSFDIVAGEHDSLLLKVPNFPGENKLLMPEFVSATFLMKLKQMAERYLGVPVTDVVITVPAYFNADQRAATKTAAKIAGLNVIHLLNEPTAAALAYNLVQPVSMSSSIEDNLSQSFSGLSSSTSSEINNKASTSKTQNIIVFDFGGGTLDVTLFEHSNSLIRVLATSGDTHLGGEDFDEILITHVLKEFEKTHRVSDVVKDLRAVKLLKEQCEQAKKTLSNTATVEIYIPSFFNGIDLRYKLTQAKFEDLCRSLFKRCLKPVEDVLRQGNLRSTDIDEVVLVGGSSKIPRVSRDLTEYFAIQNRPLLSGRLSPDEAVACGAALQCAVLFKQQQLQEQKQASSSLSSEKPLDSSLVLDKNLSDILLIDVTPLSIGIEIENGEMDVLIHRNQVIPCKEIKKYTTVSENQQSVLIKIYEGERRLVKHCRLMGTIELKDITQGLPDEVVIEITIEVNSDGEVTVKAKDLAARKGTKLTIRRQSKIAKDQVDRLIKEAAEFAHRDERQLEYVTIRDRFEAAVYQAGELLEDLDFLNTTQPDEREQLQKNIFEHLQWVTQSKNLDYSKDCADVETRIIEINTRYSEFSEYLSALIQRIEKQTSTQISSGKQEQER